MKYHLSKKVERVIHEAGIPLDELEAMLNKAAMHTADEMNRRYHQWLFRVIDGEVLDMYLDALATIGVSGPGGWVEEEHDLCQGYGCTTCGFRGLVRRYL